MFQTLLYLVETAVKKCNLVALVELVISGWREDARQRN